MKLDRVQRWATVWTNFFVLAAFASAIFMSLAILMPNWLARTSWRQGSKDTFTRIIDSPASYAGLVSLCGLVALVALSIGMWRRASIGAALAAAAFGYGALVGGNFWLGMSRGLILMDGRPTTMRPPEWEVNWPPMLPLFLLAAIVGAIGAVALAVSWYTSPAT